MERLRLAVHRVYARLKRNKALKPRHGFSVLIVDGHESSSSYLRCCEGCLERHIKIGGEERIQYYHREVIAMLSLERFPLLSDIEEQRQGEDEVAAALRLLARVVDRYPRAFQVARRRIVAHPVNPPHVIPLVELLPGKETDPDVVDRAKEFYESVGQKPIRMNYYLPGFVGTRIHVELLKEALSIIESGAADVEAVDTAMTYGLGLRWALLGPVGAPDANADGGVREFFTRYRQASIDLMNNLSPTPSFSNSFIEMLGQQMDAMVGDVPKDKIRRWRDNMIGKILKLREENDPHGLVK